MNESLDAYFARARAQLEAIREWERRPPRTWAHEQHVETRTLRREEFGAEITTDIRCACSDACAIRGRHIVHLVATVYADDLALARRLVNRLVEPRIRDLLAITNNA